MGQDSTLLTANLASPNPVAVRGHGVYLEFADGRTVLDGIAAWELPASATPARRWCTP
jgi:adenosylmethionine-8-amino-7-oxononanoate aminotransferase